MDGTIFISYRRLANPWAVQHVHERLCAEFGPARVFMDRASIDGGDEWKARIESAIETSAAVVLVFSAEWYGVRDDGSRRIDEPHDPVRSELILAHAAAKKIVPVIIDETPEPKAHDLPAALQFVAERQFSRLTPGNTLDHQIHRLIADLRFALRGEREGRKLLFQAAWIALIASALVLALRATGGTAAAEDLFARAARDLRAQIVPGAPDDIVRLEIDDEEFQELFGGRLPFDPDVVSVIVEAIARTSLAGEQCDAKRPVGINLDLSPRAANFNRAGQDRLNRALVDLARCRPVVLACPQNVERWSSGESDALWMRGIAELARRENAPLVFSSAAIEATGLRGSTDRRELGFALAEIAAGQPVDALRTQLACACPRDLSTLQHCRRDDRDAPVRDIQTLAVAYRGTDRFTLRNGLPALDALVQARVLIVGGDFGGYDRYASTTAPQGLDGVSGSAIHTHLVNGLLHHRGIAAGPIQVAAVLFGIAWVSSIVLLSVARSFARANQYFWRRVPLYAAAMAALLVAPFGALAIAVMAPSLAWLAALVTIAAVVTGGRTALSCVEIAVHGGVAWKPPWAMWRAIAREQDKASALMHLGLFVLEALALVMLLAAAIGQAQAIGQ